MDTLNTIAEIAITLVGFSGIVVIFGNRYSREWTSLVWNRYQSISGIRK